MRRLAALVLLTSACGRSYVSLAPVNPSAPWYDRSYRIERTVPPPWSWDEIAVAGASLGLGACDIATTAIGPPSGYRETNPNGRSAAIAETAGIHLAAIALGHYFGFRNLLNLGTAIPSAYACQNNFRIYGRN